jgi:hypothetical protein
MLRWAALRQAAAAARVGGAVRRSYAGRRGACTRAAAVCVAVGVHKQTLGPGTMGWLALFVAAAQIQAAIVLFVGVFGWSAAGYARKRELIRQQSGRQTAAAQRRAQGHRVRTPHAAAAAAPTAPRGFKSHTPSPPPHTLLTPSIGAPSDGGAASAGLPAPQPRQLGEPPARPIWCAGSAPRGGAPAEVVLRLGLG